MAQEVSEQVTTPEPKTRVILVGVGGASCSGKTTLAKHLKAILPDSIIIHQDDFAPPQKLLPIHPVYGVQDWDAAPGAIDWPRMVKFVQEVRQTGVIPSEHQSHDHLNEQKEVRLPVEDRQHWIENFEKLKKERGLEGKDRIIWGLLDGFLLYWNRDIIDSLDVRIFLRVPHDTLQHRRNERFGWHTAVQTDPEGTLWRDPPHYWEQIVYPAYVDANRHLFVDGDLEGGPPSGNVEELILIESLELTMSEIVSKCCKGLYSKAVAIE